MPQTRGNIQRQREKKKTAQNRKGLQEEEYEVESIIKHEWYSLPNGGTEVSNSIEYVQLLSSNRCAIEYIGKVTPAKKTAGLRLPI